MTSLRGHDRKEFPQRVRAAALRRCARNEEFYCEGCDRKLSGRTGIIFEHIIPDGLGGEPTLDNCKVHCKTCADIKTHTEDNPRMRKADSVLKKNYGLKPKARPMPGSRLSPIKMKIGGGWEYRR